MNASHSLLLDIGNTNTKIALWSPEVGVFPVAVQTVPTTIDTAGNWSDRLQQVARLWDLDTRSIESVTCCSVVPAATTLIERASKLAFSVPARFAPQGLRVPFDNIDAIPDNVGPDRVVAAYGARRLSDSRNLIVVDFGTATTVDCVQGNTFLGGVICPGLRTAAEALATRTARLPELSLTLDSEDFVFGFDTMQSLNQGFIFGFAAMIEGLVSRMVNTLGGGGKVIATGGLAPRVAKVCPALDEVQPELVFTGLAFANMDE